jgi:two-component system NtrC family sensor kinase
MTTSSEIEILQQKLQSMEKLANLGTLTAGVAHEIKNPLNFVSNFAELSIELLDEIDLTESDDEIKNLIKSIRVNQEKIHFHSKRADSIVKSILEFSKSAEGVKQPTDINKIIEEYLNLAYHSIRIEFRNFNCTIEKQLAENLPLVNIVAPDISRVILNLINNAFYAIKDKENSLLKVSTHQTEDGILFTIYDNGTGIPDSMKNRIFEPFFTTKPGINGTGLGLSLSADIIRAHHGKIEVNTKEDEFTEFKVYLPFNN